MTEEQFVPLPELETHAATIVAILGKLPPLQRATLFRMIATDFERQFPDSLTLIVLLERLRMEYESLLYRDPTR